MLAVSVLAATVLTVKFLDLETLAATQADDVYAATPATPVTPVTPVTASLELPPVDAESKALAAVDDLHHVGDSRQTEPASTSGPIGEPDSSDEPTDAVPATATTADAEHGADIDVPVGETGASAPSDGDVVDADAAPPTEAAPQTQPWLEHIVEPGESLARIFATQELPPALLQRMVDAGEAGKDLARIRPGQKIRFQFDDAHELTRLELVRSRVESVRVAVSDDAISIEEVSKDVEKRVASVSGTIESSLFADGQHAGLSDSKIMELAEIFGWDIDFALEIRAGDTFRVLLEERYVEGEKLRDGPILAAEFTNRGTTYRAVRYEDSNGDIGYYDADGQSKRRAFIRTPIKFARVSSGFSLRRWHPILKKWRSHKGVDYAAPIGTPVKATGDGRVVFRGTKSGYGKTVIVQHAGKYSTVYAHLSGYSKRATPGNRVKQGQVIAYVGKTGLATGPHLHYEFRVAGVHRDPLKVKLPKSLALPKSEIAAFQKATAPLLSQLETLTADTMVASANATLSN